MKTKTVIHENMRLLTVCLKYGKIPRGEEAASSISKGTGR